MKEKKVLTNFFVGGAPKAGTTSLWEYLSQHPNIYMGEEKEIYFFTHKWKKGIKWYNKKYKNYKGEKAVGDGSINMIVSEDAPIRVKKLIKDPKIIFLVRDPIERLLSVYKFDVMRGDKRAVDTTFNGFVKKIKKSENSWEMKMGLYSRNIKRYEKVLGESNVKTIIFENFISNTSEVTKNVYEFLGVDRSFTPNFDVFSKSGSGKNSSAVRFAYRVKDAIEGVTGKSITSGVTSWVKETLKETTGSEPEVSDDMEEFLIDYYSSDVQSLQEHLGRDLSHWLNGSY